MENLSFDCRGEQNSSNAASFKQLLTYVDISCWIDGIFKALLTAAGLLFSLLALLILLMSKRMRQQRSVFHCLLTILLLTGTLFLLASSVEILRQQGQILRDSYLYEFLFAFVVYPAKTGLLYFSIYLTVVMARERYVGLRCPVKYHAEMAAVDPWRRAARLALPVAAFSAGFVAPLLLEPRIVEGERQREEQHQLQSINEGDKGNNTLSTTYEIISSDFRFAELYVLLYKNVATFTLTMVLPFALLAFYTWRILIVLRRRRRLTNRPYASSAVQKLSAQLKAEEARKAYVLLSITVLFVLSHSGRFVLGLHECVFVAEYQRGVREHCNPTPLWVLILQSVSDLMLTLNASLCSLLYCLTSQDFCEEVRTRFSWFRNRQAPQEIVQPPLAAAGQEEK